MSQLGRLNEEEFTAIFGLDQRKLLLQQKSDAFIVMPGGLGTLEEAFDTWNAIKIGILDKPIAFMNIDGYYDGLFSFINNCTDQGFIKPNQMKIPLIESNPHLLLTKLLKRDEPVTTETVI
jgi:uncharacterized protein (TIGR00730 family)